MPKTAATIIEHAPNTAIYNVRHFKKLDLFLVEDAKMEMKLSATLELEGQSFRLKVAGVQSGQGCRTCNVVLHNYT